MVPGAWLEILDDPDRARPQRVTGAMLQMERFDIANLKQAYCA
jgi:hypothetical protein